MAVSTKHTYLITGGLGVIGLQLTRWLVSHGARHLTLIGRRNLDELDPVISQEISALRKTGVEIVAHRCDVSDYQKLSQIIKRIDQGKYPLKGVMHAAGVGGSCSLSTMTIDNFNAISCPKIIGGWNLHKLTENIPLEFFVCFSSAGSVWGARYQGHYDAANYFLDSLCYYRKTLGLKGLSINWGLLDTGGIATVEYQKCLERTGISQIESLLMQNILSFLVANNATQAVAAKLDKQLFVDIFASRSITALFSELEPDPMNAAENNLSSTSPDILPDNNDMASIEKQLEKIVLRVLGNNDKMKINNETGFTDLGLDSILAVALRSELQNTYGCSFPATIAFDYPNLTKLTSYIAKNIFGINDSVGSSQKKKIRSDILTNKDNGNNIDNAISEELLKIDNLLHED